MPLKKKQGNNEKDYDALGSTDITIDSSGGSGKTDTKRKPVIDALFKQKKSREAAELEAAAGELEKQKDKKGKKDEGKKGQKGEKKGKKDEEKTKGKKDEEKTKGKKDDEKTKGKKDDEKTKGKKDEKKGRLSKSDKRESLTSKGKKGMMKSAGGSNALEEAQEEEEVPKEPLDVTAEDVEAIFNTVKTGEAPIDISSDYPNLGQVLMPSLQWTNLVTTPVALKLTNTSYSLVVTGRWAAADMPYISGGPLLEDYVFSQIHYHWGGVVKQYDIEQKTDKLWVLSGSEHTIENEQFPLEMHAVFYRRSCGNHEAAKRAHNGIAIMAYLCADVTEEDNPLIAPVAEAIYRVMEPYSSFPMPVAPLNTLVPTFYEDYLVYKGYLKFKCNHEILWFISRNSFFVSLYQLCRFQEVMDAQGKPITNPFRETNPLDDRPILHVNPSSKYDAFIHFRDEDLKAIQDELNDEKETKKNKKAKKAGSVG